MHQIAPRLHATLESPPVGAGRALSLGQRLRLYAELGKLRLSGLAVVAVVCGYLLAGGGVGPELLALAVGAGMLSAASAFLNQFQEAEMDARMPRTQGRPLPSGRLSELEALSSGTVLAMVGYLLVDGAVGRLAAYVGLAILLGYNFAYTPLKRVTQWNTLVGAVVGALPVWMGWLAVRPDLDGAAWSLFAILFMWQLPHFWAIAWIYREDYVAGGFHMLSRGDPDGARTGAWTAATAALLVPVSLAPVAVGLAGPVYGAAALALSLAFLGLSLAFAWRPSDTEARRVFRFSLAYLPALFVILILDKVGT